MGKITLPPSGLAEDILGEMGVETGELQLVTFTIGEHYGVPISQVQEIIRVGAITKVPNTLPYMEGVINLRGRILPVLNLRKRLQLPERDITRDSRIVVTEIGTKVIGLLVDTVSHVIKVPAGFVDSPPDEILEVDTDYITGVGKLNDRIVILLDLGRLLQRERIDIGEGEKDGKED